MRPEGIILTMKHYDDLSARQRKILKFIEIYSKEHGYPPTIREIGDATQTGSTSVVNYNLNKLVEEGFLIREQRVSRGVKLTKPLPGTPRRVRQSVNSRAQEMKIPLIGKIAAGEPLQVPSNIGQNIDEDDYLDVTPMLLAGLDPSEVFALRIQGTSMIDALINDGDIVLFRKQYNAENGDMVAIWLEDRGETTLKYFYHEGDRIRLQPAHPTMQPIYVNAATCQVQGKVLSVIRIPR